MPDRQRSLKADRIKPCKSDFSSLYRRKDRVPIKLELQTETVNRHGNFLNALRLALFLCMVGTAMYDPGLAEDLQPDLRTYPTICDSAETVDLRKTMNNPKKSPPEPLDAVTLFDQLDNGMTEKEIISFLGEDYVDVGGASPAYVFEYPGNYTIWVVTTPVSPAPDEWKWTRKMNFAKLTRNGGTLKTICFRQVSCLH